MLAWLKAIYEFPSRHINTAWWVALLALAIFRPIWKGLKLLPGWGKQRRIDHLRWKLRTLQRLHGDVYSVVVYVAEEAAAIAKNAAWAFATIAFLMLVPGRQSSGLIYAYILIEAVVFFWDPASRIGEIMRGLRRYEPTVKQLQADLAKAEKGN